MPPIRVLRSIWSELLVFVGALLLFLTTATAFEPRVTDVSALRVLNGEVPYRDFWTMYAPGSFLALAMTFALFGRELIVSNLAGIVVAAAGVTVYFHLARLVCGRGPAAAMSALVAVAFYGRGYHDGLTSYPPALLLILLAVLSAARHCTEPGSRWTIMPGVLLGAAALFKHDVAGYAVIATALGIFGTRLYAQVTPVVRPVLIFAGATAVLPMIVVAVFVLLGAGPDMWQDLVVFPSTDFPYVRRQYFPILPQWRPGRLQMARELVHWGICNLPTIAFFIGAIMIWRGRQRLRPTTTFLGLAATIAFWLHWSAAHVQLNTHAISLAAWGMLVASAGLGLAGQSLQRWRWRIALLVVAGWAALFVANPLYMAYRTARRSPATTWVDLEGLRGIRMPVHRAEQFRNVKRALADAGPPSAPLLFVSSRNDVVVVAPLTPFWLTSRRSATRHHELHPGVTDTAPVQTRMLEDVGRSPLPPVVVRTYVFPDDMLDRVKSNFARHVAVGSRLLDDWIGARYEPGQRIGPYEVMRPRPGGS